LTRDRRQRLRLRGGPGRTRATAIRASRGSRERVTISRTWRQIRFLIALGDVVALLAAYVVADVLRTRIWLNKTWPEELAGFENPLAVHYWTLAVLPFVWPIILKWVHWYDPRWHRMRWYAMRAVWASCVLGLVLACLALFFRREAFPRMQVLAF